MLKKSNFIAFDIRAGGITHDRLSEIAIVVVKDGEIVDKYFEEITPPKNPLYENDFWQRHGERSLKEAWTDLRPFFEEYKYAVAFNLSVHKSNLEKSLAHYGIKLPNIEFVCAYNWAKNSLKLEFSTFFDVTDYLGIDSNQHRSQHLSQASATAELVLKLEDLTHISLEDYVKFLQQNRVQGKEKFFKSNAGEADFNGLIFQNEINDSDVQNKSIVITGDFDKFPDRDKLAEILTLKGGIVKSGISGKTEVVVIGSGAGPSKIEKIKEMINKGKNITLINQQALYQYLNL